MYICTYICIFTFKNNICNPFKSSLILKKTTSMFNDNYMNIQWNCYWYPMKHFVIFNENNFWFLITWFSISNEFNKVPVQSGGKNTVRLTSNLNRGPDFTFPSHFHRIFTLHFQFHLSNVTLPIHTHSKQSGSTLALCWADTHPRTHACTHTRTHALSHTHTHARTHTV